MKVNLFINRSFNKYSTVGIVASDAAGNDSAMQTTVINYDNLKPYTPLIYSYPLNFYCKDDVTGATLTSSSNQNGNIKTLNNVTCYIEPAHSGADYTFNIWDQDATNVSGCSGVVLFYKTEYYEGGIAPCSTYVSGHDDWVDHDCASRPFTSHAEYNNNDRSGNMSNMMTVRLLN